MNILPKLSPNLQNIILDKLFSHIKIIHNSIIKQLNAIQSYKNSHNLDIPIIYLLNDDIIYKNMLNYKYIDDCDNCLCQGTIKKMHDIPYYNLFILKRNGYKTKELYRKYYLHQYIEHSNRKYRCSWQNNFICYSCYYGICKKPCKFFVSI